MSVSKSAFSPLIIGTMRLGAWGVKMTTKELAYFIDQCLELGLNDFDHADIYGHYTTESEFGAVLKNRPDLKSKLRITTKCGIKLVCKQRPNHRLQSYNSSKAHIIASAENSLKELQVDHLDLLLLHRPDYLMHPKEIADAFDQLHQQGKVKAFGVSNFTPSQFELIHTAYPLVNHQVEISLVHLNSFEDGTLDQCLKHQIVPTAWSPFGGGALFSTSDDPKTQRIQKVAQQLAEQFQCSIDQILLAWLFKHPAGIVPVLGTSKISRVKTALAAKDIQLSHEDWYDLWVASTGVDVP